MFTALKALTNITEVIDSNDLTEKLTDLVECLEIQKAKMAECQVEDGKSKVGI